jgi:hypothetical protein
MNASVTKLRPRCVHCGKPHGRREVEEKTLKVDRDAPTPEPPPSNLKLVRRERFPQGMTDRVRFTYWDGATFLVDKRSAPFCSMTCAASYAREAYKILGKLT